MSTESTEAALFETRYRNALTAYVQREMEDALMDAFELGRKALAEGQGLLDLVAIHHTLLASLIEQSSNGADIQRRVAGAREFLTQPPRHSKWHTADGMRWRTAYGPRMMNWNDVSRSGPKRIATRWKASTMRNGSLRRPEPSSIMSPI
jgi:hypothetical protein